jgi:hypothetical protein
VSPFGLINGELMRGKVTAVEYNAKLRRRCRRTRANRAGKVWGRAAVLWRVTELRSIPRYAPPPTEVRSHEVPGVGWVAHGLFYLRARVTPCSP